VVAGALVVLRVPADGVRLDVVNGPEGFGSHESWNALVASTPSGSFFQTAQWCVAWWELLAGKPEIAIARVSDGADFLGGAALALVQLPIARYIPMHVRAVTLAGAGPGAADHCGFAIRSGAALGTTTLLFDWALRWHGDRPLLFSNLASGTALADHAAQCLSAVDEQRCPTATVTGGMSFDDVVARWTKNRRKSIRKKLATFTSAGGTFRWIDHPSAVSAVLPALFELHDRRRKALGLASSFASTPENRAFHKRLASYSDAHSGCWVQCAKIGHETIGMLYGFRLGSTYSVYQSGWDPRWSALSPGLIQYAAAYRHAVENGCTTYDMCRGQDPYKARFATDTRVERTYARASGLSGSLLRSQWAARRWRRSRRSEYSDAVTVTTDD
jgi:CelD/BcsL family acetyltransferase involved in cellulose biosynthesis